MQRPWEPDLGRIMTTNKWMKIEPVEVFIDELIHTNSIMDDEGDDTSFCGDTHIHVIVWNGKKYISDGNNRVAKHRRRGEKTIKARVLIL
jgi:hypothetical protein